VATTKRKHEKIDQYLAVKVERGFLQNIESGLLIEFMFNPVQFEESYQAAYVRHKSPGLSHQPLHFVGNANTSIPLELIFDQLVFNERLGRNENAVQLPPSVWPQNDADAWRRNLIALILPRKNQRITHASPPPVFFYWPGFINMRVRVMTLKFRHVLFATGRPLPRILVASIQLEEEPLGRLYSEDMIRTGTFRSWGTSSRPQGRS